MFDYLIAARNLQVQLKQQLGASPGLSTTVASTITDAMQNCVDAMAANVEAKADVGQLLSDPQYTNAVKIPRSQALLTKAFDQASRALDALKQVKDDTRTALESKWRPARPASVSDTLLVDCKNELKALFDVKGGGAAGGNSVAQVAAARLQEALTAGDDLTVYCIAGGPLDTYYDRCGINRQLRNQTFAAVVGPKGDKGGNPAPGPELAALLGDGPGSVGAFLLYCRQQLTSDQRQSQQWLAGMLNISPLEVSNQQYLAAQQAQQAQARQSLATQQARLAGPPNE
jgi:hypothetical protein